MIIMYLGERRKKNEDDITFIIFHNIIVGLVKIKRDEFTVGKVIIKLFTLLIEKFPSTLPRSTRVNHFAIFIYYI